ncbi:MAG: hypothetical protein CMN58_03140 [Solibacterales bacterium]|nr:hypothetical protein [Bryobacterales bacterium]
MKIREDRTIWTASKLMNRRQVIKRTALLSEGMVLLKHSLGDQTQPGGDARRLETRASILEGARTL